MLNWNRNSSEQTVISSAECILDSNSEAVLATVVDVEGSAYRHPGAKVLISEQGDHQGSITAGCLNDQLSAIAEDVLAAGTPRLETFDLMENDTWGLGIGCNGVIMILFEPVSTRHSFLIQAHQTRDSALVGTILQSSVDGVDPWLPIHYTPDQGISPIGGSPQLPEWLRSSIARRAAQLFDTGSSEKVDFNGPDGGVVSVFLDGIVPSPRLVIIGTNHDVRPVVELASETAFHTTVVGYRGGTATSDRFPNADSVYSTTPARLQDSIEVDDRTYFVVMTHNFIDDRLTIAQLTDTPTPYIGLMGPRDRLEEMLKAYDDEAKPDADDLLKLYSPIGLNLGGGAPYEIAVSILSEILAIHNDRKPEHLHQREGSIHDRLKHSSN